MKKSHSFTYVDIPCIRNIQPAFFHFRVAKQRKVHSLYCTISDSNRCKRTCNNNNSKVSTMRGDLYQKCKMFHPIILFLESGSSANFEMTTIVSMDPPQNLLLSFFVPTPEYKVRSRATLVSRFFEYFPFLPLFFDAIQHFSWLCHCCSFFGNFTLLIHRGPIENVPGYQTAAFY